MRRLFLILLLTLGVFACSNGGDDTVPTASVPSQSDESASEREVEAAYLKSWDVYANAMLTLDTALLDSAFAGDALRVKTEEVNDLRAKNQAARMQVEHRTRDVSVSESSATLRDDYVNHSVVLDAVTKEPLEPDPSTVLYHEYRLQRFGEMWKVIAVVAHS